jgi:hypothetical protein
MRWLVRSASTLLLLLLLAHAPLRWRDTLTLRLPTAETKDSRRYWQLSRFANSANLTVPLEDYPRPQLQRRRWMSLNGWWEWQEIRGRLPAGRALRHRVRVPFPIEAPLSGLGMGAGAAGLAQMRYRRYVLLPVAWRAELRGGGGVLLHLGAVEWSAIVRVNGVVVDALAAGSGGAGGLTPSSFDVSRALRRVADAAGAWLEIETSDVAEEEGKPVGKQRASPRGIWYTASSGLWQVLCTRYALFVPPCSSSCPCP